MTLTARNPKVLWSAAAISLLLLAIAVLATTAGVSQRSAVYSQLQRPASYAAPAAPAAPPAPAAATAATAVTIGPGAVGTTVQVAPYGVGLRLTPNVASRPNELTLVLRRGGTPVSGARVSVAYSMPSMNMSDVYSSRLSQTAAGTYGASQPVFGMPGTWQLRFTVAPQHGAQFTVVTNDRMIR